MHKHYVMEVGPGGKKTLVNECNTENDAKKKASQFNKHGDYSYIAVDFAEAVREDRNSPYLRDLCKPMDLGLSKKDHEVFNEVFNEKSTKN